MHDTALLFVDLIVGVLMGIAFFSALWWSVRKTLQSPTPSIWLLGSRFARTAAVIGGFYVLARGDWRALVAAVIGFVIGRGAVTWHVRQTKAPHAPQS